MDIPALPHLVIEEIIKYAVDTPPFLIRRWSYSLRLLAVCRQWRNIGKPIIYRQIYVNSKTTEGTGQLDNGWLKTGGIDKTILESNLELINDLGMADMAREILIDVGKFAHLNSFFCTIMVMLWRNPFYWKSIKGLRLRLSLDEEIALEDEDDEDAAAQAEQAISSALQKNISRATSFVKVIVTRVPGIKYLNFNISRDDELATVFCSQLANVYANRLQILICPTTLALDAASFSTGLTSLCISSNWEMQGYLPHVHAASLKKLTLYDVHAEFTWEHFKDTDNLTLDKVVFSELQHLLLSYDITTFDLDTEANLRGRQRLLEMQSNTALYKAHFPKLNTFIIENDISKGSVSTNGIYPTQIHTLVLRNSFEMTKQISKSKLAQVSVLEVKFTSLNVDLGNEFYKVTNSLFSNIKIFESAAVILDRVAFDINPQLIKWPNLTTVAFHDPVNWTLLISLLSKLPNLRKLYVHRVAIEHMDQEANGSNSQTKSVELASTPPLHAPVAHLVFDYADNNDDIPRLTQHIQQLMTQLRTLKSLVCRMDNISQIISFCKNVSSEYPWLKDIHLNNQPLLSYS